jgi:pimeloyl-ACP methyl ester carboxylesterase
MPPAQTAVLYLHGFASSPASRKAQFFRERFAERGVQVRILELDEGRFEKLTLTGQLGVIERAASGQPVSLIGSSMGGYLAALYAARHPEVERVVMMAPAFDFGRRWRERIGHDGVEQWRRTGRLTVYHYGMDREMSLGYELLEDALQYEDEPDVRQPALIFHGVGDDVVPLAASERYCASRPNVRLRTFDSGHELVDVLGPIWEESYAFFCGGS